MGGEELRVAEGRRWSVTTNVRIESSEPKQGKSAQANQNYVTGSKLPGRWLGMHHILGSLFASDCKRLCDSAAPTTTARRLRLGLRQTIGNVIKSAVSRSPDN